MYDIISTHVKCFSDTNKQNSNFDKSLVLAIISITIKMMIPVLGQKFRLNLFDILLVPFYKTRDI
jgi:hypothetical protein